MVTMRKEW
uniref:Uncharacterized protein n=1 Tax=Anguilla anguilla TaxID=7936 RepID=A0A0E9RC88_ANGAN